MTHRIRLAGVCAAVASAALIGGPTASAQSTATGARAISAIKGAQAAQVVPAVVPAGYKLVSKTFLAPTGVQTHDSVTCPPTPTGPRQPQGGGVAISSRDFSANISSSYPSGTSWAASVNNNSGLTISFTVYAVCAKPHAGYTVSVSSAYTNVAGRTDTGYAGCPTGTKVTGGGASTTSGSLGENVNSSLSSNHNAWQVIMSNATGGDTQFNVYAVCEKYSTTTGGYSIATAMVANPPNSQTFAQALCPAGEVPVGGGGYSDGGLPTLNMNSTYPSGASWITYENNASGIGADIISFAICAL